MTFIIKKYESSDKVSWNKFLENCKNYHFMFDRDFMEYHSERFKDCSIIVSNNKDKIIALLPGNIDQDIFYSHQGLTFGGFLTDKNIHTAELLDIFDQLKNFLVSKGIKKIIYKAMPYIYHKYPAQEDLYVLFRNNAKIFRRDVSSTIYLEDELKYSKGRKWGINKAKKNNIVCKNIEDPSMVWDLITEVLLEHHNVNPVHNKSEISHLKSIFPKNIKTYAAFFHDDIVSACVTFENDQVIHTQYLACNSIGRDYCALDMLIDYVISESLERAKYFDFGISNEDEGKYLNNGLISQKESFGARAITHDFYSVDLI